jgi:nucleotide-binding universal stress UspA family protein
MVPYPVPPYPVVEEADRIRAEARRIAEHCVGTWTEKYPDVDVRAEVAEGQAARELVEVSRTAGLLVVGTRGHGGLAGMLLGSVSHAVLRHAHCPRRRRPLEPTEIRDFRLFTTPAPCTTLEV